jgi:hypothetical protein
VEALAELGLRGTLRALRTNPINREGLSETIGETRSVDEERLLRLARARERSSRITASPH